MQHPPARTRRERRGFTLLEVMLATGILVVALLLLVETQGTAAQMTEEADRIIVATQLAQEKLAEVRLLVEREGFQASDVHDEGDFDDFGDEALNVEFGSLDDFHWEYLITEVDLELAGDLAGSMQALASAYAPDAETSALDLSGFAGMLSPELLTDALDPFVREVRVRVWWGDDLKEAEELGNEVVLTTHVINPSGQMFQQDAGRAAANQEL